MGQTALDLINSFFDYFYMALIIMGVVVSLTTPVDRGVIYFKFLMVTFGLLLVFTEIGIVAYLVTTGFYPKVMEFDINRYPHW